MTNTRKLLLGWNGEFKERSQEDAYRAHRFPEFVRYARAAFFWAVVCNLLFYASDLRFLGQPHFGAALAARTTIVLASLAGYSLAARAKTFSRLQNLCTAWCVPVIAGCAVLLSPRSTVALIVLFLLPLIYYLVLPMSFRRTVAAGLACSGTGLGAHLLSVPDTGVRLGLFFAMLLANVLLGLARVESNRLRRLEWAAAREARAKSLELAEQHRTLKGLMRAVPIPLVVLSVDTGRLILANDTARRYFSELVPGATPDLGKYLDRKELLRISRSRPPEGSTGDFETRLRLADGSWRNVLLVTAVVTVRGENALLVSVVDITPHKRLEAHLQHLAGVDPLTGLSNRARFFVLAGEEIRRAERYARPLAVVMLDIDYFKSVNDTHGHETGDKVLATFGELCRAHLRDCDIVGRLGGEEFCLLLPETDSQGAMTVADRFRAAVERHAFDGLARPLTVSLGVSSVRPGESQVDAALSRADQALYEAKRGGRNRVVSHTGDTGAQGANAPGPA